MSDHIRITKAEGTWVVRSGAQILGESANALELREGSYPAVIYFPRDDIAMALFDRSATRSTCPWKGEASYFSLVTPSERIDDAAWSYETPKAGVEAIAGHLAFYPNKVTLERL